MPERVNFFDEIAKNKRNSWILIAVMMAIFSALVFVIVNIFNYGMFGILLGVFALIFYFLVAYFSGDAIVLKMSGAREAKKAEVPFLFETIEGLALASQIPIPKIYIIEDPSPNAFATGRDPKHSSVALTTGLLQMLNRQELEGVIAHEISHIANYDIRFSLYAVVFVGAIALLSNLVLRFAFFGAIVGGGDRRERGGNGLLALVGLVFAILAPIFALMVSLALSREREYLADANGAKLTRYPAGLASALEKITQLKIPTKTANESTASLYFSNPFPGKVQFLFSTHPDPAQRIKRLRAM